ncbi:MAG: FKBP-type peptidyl-prolyl cis-trans isomerase [Paludibacteraceae bacterium]|nr:FKBP-type peptidyl-prolyl cis-trans isomerase [Paludibacteraceae bacterium]
MEQKNYYVALTYDLKVGEEDELMESTSVEHPFTFYTGMGMVLEDFEKAIMACEVDGNFDFTIPADRAYGEYDDESVIDLPKNIFEIDGKIDEKILFEGNIVPLQDSEGNRINASVVSVGKDTVTVDLNHPLAGENLHFVGKVLVKRLATAEEIQKLMQPSCGGCGGSCGGGCSCDSDCSCGGCE